MPWCPKCRQEYMESATRCAECGGSLVADLAGTESRPAADPSRAARIEAPPAALAAIAPGLERSGIPVRRDASGLSVPLDLAERVVGLLSSFAEVEHEGETIRVTGPRRDVEAELPVDPAVLDQSNEQLAAAVADAIPRLVGLFGQPSPRLQRAALAKLRTLDERGAARLVDVLLWTSRGGFRRPFFGLLALVAEAPPAALAVGLAAALPKSSGVGRELLLHALARLPDRRVMASVLPLLEDDDPIVREEADEVLISCAGLDVGFDAEAEPREREQAIQLWREWIAKNCE